MTVADLIMRLKNMPQERGVLFEDKEDRCHAVTFAFYDSELGHAILVGSPAQTGG